MQRRGFENNEGTVLLDIFKITMGVFIGSLAAVFVYEAVVEWRVERAARQAVAEMRRQSEKLNREESARRAQVEGARLAAERETEQRRSALAMAERLQREQRDRKEAAWKRFHTPSQACQLDSGTAACANEYMAARKRFEAGYVDR